MDIKSFKLSINLRLHLGIKILSDACWEPIWASDEFGPSDEFGRLNQKCTYLKRVKTHLSIWTGVERRDKSNIPRRYMSSFLCRKW